MPNQNVNKENNKPKDMKKSLLKLMKYLKSFLPVIIISIFLVVANTVIRLIGPNKIGDITNIVDSMNFEISDIWKIAIELIILYAFGAIFIYIANYLIAKMCYKVAQNLRSDISKKINKLPLKYIDRKPYGDVLSIVANDVDRIGETLQVSVADLTGAIVLFIGSIVMMFVTNWLMAICAIVSTVVGFALMSLIIKKSQKYFLEQQTKLGELDGVVEEIYSGQSIIKTYNAKDETVEKFEKVNHSLYNSGRKAQFLSGLMHPLMGCIGNFGYIVVCIVGAVLFFNGKISFGVISSFMIYIRLFTNPLSQIAQSMTSVQTAAAASERVFEFLEAEEVSDESHKHVKLKDIKGDVEFKDVKFGYDKDKEIIHGFSASVKHGQKVAIVGPTGAGKTTIVNLLMRFYEMNGGDILVDGVSIKKMTRSQVRDIFSMVLQDTWLFEGTIRENLVYNKEGITDEMLEKVCAACGLDHFIKTLPHGFDTVLSDETNVSVGQKQLLTIARAMLQNTPMLILDEATSNVDTRTEGIIQKAMDKLTEDRTSFVIAHRLSTIKNADLILVLNGGDVIESGSHKELIKKKGFYAELYNSQFTLAGLDGDAEV